MHPAPHSRYRADPTAYTHSNRHPHFAGEHALGQSLSALAKNNRPKSVVEAPIFPALVQTLAAPAPVVAAPVFGRFNAFNENLARRQAQTVANLRKVAAVLGITGRSAMRKDELSMEIASQDTDAEAIQWAEDNAS